MTRTALTMNGLAEFRCAPYGKALKRHQNKGTKPAADISIYFLKKTLTFSQKYGRI
jgi:hypothetical protein